MKGQCSLSVSLSASLFIRYINHYALFHGARVRKTAKKLLLPPSCAPIRIEILSSNWTDLKQKKNPI
jgi:hypothetical protein